MGRCVPIGRLVPPSAGGKTPCQFPVSLRVRAIVPPAGARNHRAPHRQAGRDRSHLGHSRAMGARGHDANAGPARGRARAGRRIGGAGHRAEQRHVRRPLEREEASAATKRASRSTVTTEVTNRRKSRHNAAPEHARSAHPAPSLAAEGHCALGRDSLMGIVGPGHGEVKETRPRDWRHHAGRADSHDGAARTPRTSHHHHPHRAA